MVQPLGGVADEEGGAGVCGGQVVGDAAWPVSAVAFGVFGAGSGVDRHKAPR